MIKLLLIPHKYKKLGWIILSIGLLASAMAILFPDATLWMQVKVFALFNPDAPNGFAGTLENNIADEVIAVFLIIGGLLVAFSKVKIEDEGVVELRLHSLQWGVFLNYFILLLGIILVYELSFLTLLAYNIITPLLDYIIRFHYVMNKKPKEQA